MKQKTQERPYHLSIDVDQWRSDIRTFAETTGQALRAIIAELSSSCSGGSTGDEAMPAGHKASTDWTTNNIPQLEQADGQDERLAKLKSQLARRLSKSN